MAAVGTAGALGLGPNKTTSCYPPWGAPRPPKRAPSVEHMPPAVPSGAYLAETRSHSSLFTILYPPIPLAPSPLSFQQYHDTTLLCTSPQQWPKRTPLRGLRRTPRLPSSS